MKTSRERAIDLCKKMTIEEKCGQLCQNILGFQIYERDSDNQIILTDSFKKYIDEHHGIGVIYGLFRADPWSKRSYSTGGITAKEMPKAHNLVQKYVISHSRLGIPALMEEEAPHGRQALDSVLYPSNIGIGCSFNPDLYRQEVSSIAKESKFAGVQSIFFSLFDVGVDPRWGRFEECYGEDPFLIGVFAEAAVNGAKDSHEMICCKHYVGQGAASGGHNGCCSNMGEREMREIHLPAVKKAVKAGADFIMAAYNQIDGVPCHVNKHLLKDILRKEFNYTGVIRSDGCGADLVGDSTFGHDYAQGIGACLSAGLETGLWDKSFEYLPQAVEKGYCSEDDIDKAVIDLLTKKFECGLMDKPYVDENDGVRKEIFEERNSHLAKTMAEESFVLLKNDGVLPISKSTKQILLVGENLKNPYYMYGDYTSERIGIDSIVDAFQKRSKTQFIEGWNFKKGITCSYDNLLKAADSSALIIFGVGGSSVRDFKASFMKNGAAVASNDTYMDCGEGMDLASLKLSSSQYSVFSILRHSKTPIVTLILAGRPYELDKIASDSNALVFLGYPGDEGAKAVLSSLYGDNDCFGRLSFSWPKIVGQLPITYNQRETRPYVDVDDHPLFPFGYGLNFASISYSSLVVSKPTIKTIKQGGSLNASFIVNNLSSTETKVPVELFIQKIGGSFTHRRIELKGFSKPTLKPKESKQVSFSLFFDDLADWDGSSWCLHEMKIRVMAGFSCEHIILEETINLKNK